MRGKWIKLLSVVCVISVAVAGTLGAAGRVYTAATTLSPAKAKLPVIIIDAGHGGFDGGAVGLDGTNEKDINLAVSLKVDALLKAIGFETINVRTTDTSVDTEGNSIKQKKKSDILNRFKLMKENPDCIYLCIHQNRYSSASVHGAQVFYTKGNDEAKLLAQSVQDSIKDFVQQDNKRLIKPCTKDVYLIYNAKETAVLIECGFISNENDLANLKDSTYQRKLAFAIACGLTSYLNMTGSGIIGEN